jgi:hypothetical protein
MSMREVTVFSVVTCCLAGCSSVPDVKYASAPTASLVTAKTINQVPNRYDFWTTSVELKKEAKGAMQAAFATAPVDEAKSQVSVTITGVHHWYKDSSIWLTTASDTNLLTSVSTKVTDNRATYIAAAGEILATVATVAVAAADHFPSAANDRCDPTAITIPDPADPNAAFDYFFNLYDVLPPNDAQCRKEGKPTVFDLRTRSTGGSDLARVSIDPPPPDALELAAQKELLLENATHVFLAPACRSGTLEFDSKTAPPTSTHSDHHASEAHQTERSRPETSSTAVAPLVRHTVHFLFSDPRYVQATQLPVQGTLTVKSQCGVSAGADSGTADTTPAIAKAIADALQGIATAATGSGSSSSSSSN